jgi:hypothetical protein
MEHQSYILFASSEEDKQRILDVINAHNSFYDDKTEARSKLGDDRYDDMTNVPMLTMTMIYMLKHF